jgi:hypothetical protein
MIISKRENESQQERTLRKMGILISDTIRCEIFRVAATFVFVMGVTGNAPCRDRSDTEDMYKLETMGREEFGHLRRGRLGVVGTGFEPLTLALLVAAATARVDAVLPLVFRAALTCFGDSFAAEISLELPWIHALRMWQAS